MRVGIDRVTRMSRGLGGTTRPVSGDRTLNERSDSTRWTEAHAPEEFFIDRLVAHRYSPTSMKYKLRWYGYTPRMILMNPRRAYQKPLSAGTGKTIGLKNSFWRLTPRKRVSQTLH